MKSKYRLFIILIIPFLTAFQEIKPDTFTRVYVSALSVNRITCSENIKDVIYSKEKPVELKLNEGNLFIKYLLKKEDDKDVPIMQDVDMYVVCGNSVFNLMLIPRQDLPAQTVTLQSPVPSIKKNMAAWKGMAHEEKLTKLLKMAYTGAMENVKVLQNNTPIHLEYPGLKIERIYEGFVEGEGLKISEYSIKADTAIAVRETDFLKISSSPLLVALDKTVFSPGDTIRLFIIEASTEVGK